MKNIKLTKIRIITQDNGVGLIKDAELLSAALMDENFRIKQYRFKTNKFRKWVQRLVIHRIKKAASINIYLERLHPSLFASAKINVLVPNPEWTLAKWLRHLPALDFVLAKTRHAEVIFSDLGCKTIYTGFTSEDRWLPEVEKRAIFFHLAGKSSNKGTKTLIKLWEKHPDWPLLTIVQNPKRAKIDVSTGNIRHMLKYLDDAELKLLQNQHLFHICTSETEGFGHYLMEAMSMQAVVITTNAPPMNEMITPDRGVLVDYESTSEQCLATCYHVGEAQLHLAVEQALSMDQGATAALGFAARNFFLDNDAQFKARILKVMQDIAGAASAAKNF